MGVYGMTEQLRNRAGAQDGATSSAIMASGGAVKAAVRSINPDPVNKTKEALGGMKRLITSGSTDATSDILAKMSGQTDPNPGHTEPAETSADPAALDPTKSGASSASASNPTSPALPFDLPDLPMPAVVAGVAGVALVVAEGR